MPPTLEIAAVSVEDARQAQTGGADSLELLRDLGRGGLTPQLELVRAVRDAVTIPIHVMLRPHDNGFVYTRQEIDAMLAALENWKPLGIDGVVFGAQTADGRVDVALMRAVAAQAAPIPITLHRALDFSVEPEQTLAALAGIVPRVLTAGPAPTAWEGQAVVRHWVARFGAQFRFVSSGGLTREHLTRFAAEIGAAEAHVGGAARTHDAVDSLKVRALKAALNESSR
ncbi:MAG: copper homeostasis protein CutC [Anaerolineae bacterium]|nr:copper homeostasis protein CutC [Anaerolineae bacterium]